MHNLNDGLQEGDKVRMHGQRCVGEVVELTGTRATVAFQAIEVNISLSQLEKAQVEVEAVLARPPTCRRSVSCVQGLALDDFTAFDTKIDLHGMTVCEALNAVEKWIDRAALLGHKHLKIIHGKGSGSLRGAVREYLSTHELVRLVDKQFAVCMGGGGVTWLELE